MKKQTKAQAVLEYIASHPKAKASEIAKALNVGISTIYQVKYNASKKVAPPFKTIAVKKNQMNLTEMRDRQVRLIKALTDKTDNVNHPPHYKVGGIETIDFIEAKSLGYNLGNVVKYITRADHKGSKKEDLLKAQWYLDREIRNLA